MIVRLLFVWLLCSAAFFTHREPLTPIGALRAAVSGMLIAIAIALVAGVSF